MRQNIVRRVAVIGVAAALGAVGVAAAARQAPPSPDVLSALLVEVRGLRAAMEQMASAGPRIELALGRLQLQEQRVNNALRRHADVRERLAGTERRVDALARDIEQFQDGLQQGAFEEKDRKAVQGQLADIKGEYAQMNADLQRLRAEETEVAQLVAMEQTRWAEINQRLEDLERALTRR